jgi:glutamyl-tRNA synthetase
MSGDKIEREAANHYGYNCSNFIAYRNPMTSNQAPVVTRFAPSPTGYLHIGGARTALFNWLFTRAQGGKFLLRIEDTDKKRSTDDAIEAILDGLGWLGLLGDEDPCFQSTGQERHAAVAKELVETGHAYHCYASPDELQEMRTLARKEGRPMRYDGRWRNRDASEAPDGVDPVIRLKAPREGSTTITDLVQGSITVPNNELDDMVLLRSDGTPTYMLSVVVDDHDMGVSHVIRGDDHLTNAFRQTQVYMAMGWQVPEFAHIPLIHGPDGAKLSKRHGALGIDAYRDMGYLPEAILNYLMRLGWSYGDKEIISTEEAIELFTLDNVNKGAARFDFAKLENLNGHYIRACDENRLCELTLPFIEAALGRPLSSPERERLQNAMPGLKERAKTLVELASSALFYFHARPLVLNEKAKKLLSDENCELLGTLIPVLKTADNWSNEEALLELVQNFAQEKQLKLGKVAQPMRAALTGSNISPSVFEILLVLGKEESLSRLIEQAK